MASIALPQVLEDSRIQALPRSAYYIANFISEEEEAFLLEKIRGLKIATAPKPRWKQLTHRRLQTWPSDLVRNRLLKAPLPRWLEEPVIPRLLSIPVSATASGSIFDASPHQRANHVLVNEYPPGVGIMPHKDGAAYHPVVCTVSLGGTLCLDLYPGKEDGVLDKEPTWRILQEPRSLLITTQQLYEDFLHGIAETAEDANLNATTVANWNLLGSPNTFEDGRNVRTTRTSLTYRDVLKVSSFRTA